MTNGRFGERPEAGPEKEKMKTEQLIGIIGAEVATGIVAGRYGDGGLTANGFVVCDPCYIFDYPDLNRARLAGCPWWWEDARRARGEWHAFKFNGETAYARACSDGSGWFGRSVDSGEVVAVPIMALSPECRIEVEAAMGVKLEASL